MHTWILYTKWEIMFIHKIFLYGMWLCIFCLIIEVAISQRRNLIAKHGPTPWIDEHARWSLMSSPIITSPKSWYIGSKFMDKIEVWKKLLGVICGIFMVSSINPFRAPMSMKCFLFLSATSNYVELFCARSHKGSIFGMYVVFNITKW